MQPARTFTNTALDVVQGGLFTFHVRHHDIVVHLYRSLDELLAIHGGLIDQIGGNIGDFVVLRQARIVPDVCLLRKNIDHTGELVLSTDR